MAAQEDLFESVGTRPEGIIQDVHVDYNAELGRGSDATVYGGTWRAPQANVAVKVLHPLLTEPQAGGREVFLRKYGDECDRLQNLRHDNVVKFIGVTPSREGTPALVTERMDTTLRACSQATELSLLEQLDIFCDASAGLAYLHSRGVVHRDLTTRNVLLSAPPNRRAKLADVGLSRSLHGKWWFLNYGSALTRCPGTMSYMPPEALAERPAYDERLDSFSFGVLMTAVILRRDPSTAVLHAARERILPDGKSKVIPEVERRASDLNAIGADHPLLDLIKECLDNDPKRRPSARTIHENLHGVRTRLFPNAQRKPETDQCLDCERSNQEVVRLNTEVAFIWSRLEQQMQTSVLTVAEKDSNIQELRARLTEAEETVTTVRDHQQELQARLTEAEGTMTTMRDHEQDLQVRLSEAQNMLEVTRQEAARTQEEAAARAHAFEEQILRERERATHERELLTVQLEQASSEMEEMKSALFLQRVYQYNLNLKRWFLPDARVKSLGEWRTILTDLPADDIASAPRAAVHFACLYVTFRTKSLGCVLYRSKDKMHWERMTVPLNMHRCDGLLSYDCHLICLFLPVLQEHIVLFKLITENNEEKSYSWEKLSNGRCLIVQQMPAFFVVDHKLVLVGGLDSEEFRALLAVSGYCLQTNRWIIRRRWPCLPKAILGMQAVCLGGCWCLFGGQVVINRMPLGNCTVFRVKVENGKPLGNLDSISVPPTPYSQCAGCGVFNHAVVAGGLKQGVAPQDGVFLLDSASETWLQMPSLNVARSLSRLVVFQDSILCIGGLRKGGWCSTIEELSIKL